MNSIEMWLGYSIGFIVSVFGGVLFVELVLSFFPDFSGENKIEDSEGEGIKHAGKTIGIFERIIVTLLVFLSAYNAISFVFIAKSLARFNLLRKRGFAEYYLIGTFSSLSFAILVGVVTLKLVTFCS